ncbi:uncharacterized protein LOC132562155 [Ylistrum balloti]|uniref:uncharacterized protein LOC132562155 n=1 Tax=Ylistrum balloti TaxID=509963 RepID=UPI002905BA55|nr:uncharacterized protein LOC132562155 [Ylistrum balloti]
MRKAALNKFSNAFFHRVILLLLLGMSFCLLLFVMRRRLVMKGLTQTNSGRFDMNNIRNKPFEGLHEEYIFFPSSTLSWFPTVYSSLRPFSSSTTTSKPTQAQNDNSADINGQQREENHVRNTLRDQLTKTNHSNTSSSLPRNENLKSDVKPNKGEPHRQLPAISESGEPTKNKSGSNNSDEEQDDEYNTGSEPNTDGNNSIIV